MQKPRLLEILAKIPSVRVAVVGDFFLDRYWEVAPALDEPSVETGLTAYQVTACRVSPGAAGTVMNNLAALGVGRLHAVGFRGLDGEGYMLAECLKQLHVEQKHLHATPLRMTPCYTKPMRAGVEMNRFDIKNRTVTPTEIEDAIIASIREISSEVDAIIAMDQVSEPDCGVLTDRVRACLISLGQQGDRPLIYADSRERIGLYRDVIIKCNEREVLESQGLYGDTAPAVETLIRCGRKLAESTGRAVFVTMGERGQTVIDGVSETHVPAVKVQGEIDICGAGDASTAACVSAMCAGATYAEAAMIANLASSVTIRKLGQTGTATVGEIVNAFEEWKMENG